jgi:uncharacterized protein DUF5676
MAMELADSGRLSIKTVGLSLGSLFVIFFVLCIALGIIVPDGDAHKPFLQFLPGFTWLSWSSLSLGLAESLGYGWFIAVLFVPLYNFFDTW